MSTTAFMSARQRHNVLIRHRGPDDPAVAQARRALELARTEEAIRRAIDQAPPLDADTLARIRALIPPGPGADEQADQTQPDAIMEPR